MVQIRLGSLLDDTTKRINEPGGSDRNHVSDKSAQILFAEDRLLRAGRSFGRAKFAEVNNDRQSSAATGRYLDAAAELVAAGVALWQADEDVRNRRTNEGLKELRDATTYAPPAAWEGEMP